jgi:hypothetical protein
MTVWVTRDARTFVFFVFFVVPSVTPTLSNEPPEFVLDPAGHDAA